MMNAKPNAAYRIFDPSRLFHAIRESKLTYVEIADKCGTYLTADAIRKWAHGDVKKPLPENLKLVASALGKNPEDFYKPLSTKPIDKDRKDLQTAWAHEAAGEFSLAANAYKAALDHNQPELIRRQIESRAILNQEIAKQLRKQYAGGRGQTIIPVYDSIEEIKKGQPSQWLPKKKAHERGLLHTTVHLVFVLGINVACFIRGLWQTFSGRYDFFGGHSISEETFLETAYREASEELHVYVGKSRIDIDFKFIEIDSFKYNITCELVEDDGTINSEFSMLYVVRLPEHPCFEFAAFDENTDGTEIGVIPEKDLFFEPMSDWVMRWERDPKTFADGASRIFKRYTTDTDFKNRFDSVINQTDNETL